MKRMIALGGLMLWALVAGAEARGWGFDKDTVYESNPGGDTVRLVNNGADTLRLDSITTDILTQPQEGGERNEWCLDFTTGHFPDPGSNRFTVCDNNPSASRLQNYDVPSQQVKVFQTFRLYNAAPVTAKAAFDQGDTLMFRLRFRSNAEEDTLIMKGIYGFGVSIAPRMRDSHSLNARDLNYDALGRVFIPSWNSPVLRVPSK